MLEKSSFRQPERENEPRSGRWPDLGEPSELEAPAHGRKQLLFRSHQLKCKDSEPGTTIQEGIRSGLMAFPGNFFHLEAGLPEG